MEILHRELTCWKFNDSLPFFQVTFPKVGPNSHFVRGELLNFGGCRWSFIQISYLGDDDPVWIIQLLRTVFFSPDAVMEIFGANGNCCLSLCSFGISLGMSNWCLPKKVATNNINQGFLLMMFQSWFPSCLKLKEFKGAIITMINRGCFCWLWCFQILGLRLVMSGPHISPRVTRTWPQWISIFS